MNFNGPARPLSGDDVTLIAGYLGCHVAAVRAVLQVEAAGKGFDAKGRPKMLFEPHVFWRELGPGAKRTKAAGQGIAYAKWQPGAYPKDSYPRLLKAMAIDETAALRSASWGLGQVLGTNHSAAGFLTVQEMVRAMTVSEGAQLYAMARFIVTNKLHLHLRSRDWAGFARGYNGAGYKKNAYDQKMATAYWKRPSSEKVTPPPTSAAQLEAIVGTLAKRPVEPTPEPIPAPRVPRELPVDAPLPETAGPDESGSSGFLGYLVAALIAVGLTGAVLYFRPWELLP